MAGIASICVAYGAGSLMKSMHGDITSPQNGNANGSPAPAMRLGDPRNKFSLHHILRNGFPGLQVCFEAQEILCEAWMPNVARILVSLRLSLVESIESYNVLRTSTIYILPPMRRNGTSRCTHHPPLNSAHNFVYGTRIY